MLPGRADALWHRARVRLLTGNEEGAILDLERVTRSDADHVPAWLLLASLYDAREKLDLASEAKKLADEASLAGWGRYWIAGQRAARRVLWSEASEHFARAIHGVKSGEYSEPYVGWLLEMHLAQSVMLLRDGRPLDALEELAVVEYFWPRSIECCLFQAEASLKLANAPERSDPLFERAMSLADSHFVADEIATFAVNHLLNVGDRRRARAWHARIRSESRRAAAIVFQLEKAGELDAAEVAARKVVELRPKDASSHFELARFLFRQERFEEALSPLRKGLEIDPDGDENLWWRMTLATSLARVGRSDDARRQLHRFGGDAPQETRVDIRRAEAYFALRDAERAMSLLLPIIDREPKNPWPTSVAAEGLLDCQQPERALKYANSLLEHQRQHSKDYALRATIHERLDRWDEALADLERACQAPRAA